MVAVVGSCHDIASMMILRRLLLCFPSTTQFLFLFMIVAVCRQVAWAWTTTRPPLVRIDYQKFKSPRFCQMQTLHLGRQESSKKGYHLFKNTHATRAKPLFISIIPCSNISSSISTSTHQDSTLLFQQLDDDDDTLEQVEAEDLEVANEDLTDDIDEDDDDIYQNMEDDEIAKLPRGIPTDYAIVQQWTIPMEGMDLAPANKDIEGQSVVDRLLLTSTNISLPVALTLLLPNVYPTLSRARKICRKGNILLIRGASWLPTADGNSKVGRVGDRVYPGGKRHLGLAISLP